MNKFTAFLNRMQTKVDGLAKAMAENVERAAAEKAAKAEARSQAEEAAAFRWPEDDNYISVVGESFYQDDLRRLAGDHGTRSANVKVTALIKPDDDNPHDDKAVSIWIRGLQVGHLSRDEARSFRRRLSQKGLAKQTTACSATIMGGRVMDDGKRASYGVLVHIKPFW